MNGKHGRELPRLHTLNCPSMSHSCSQCLSTFHVKCYGIHMCVRAAHVKGQEPQRHVSTMSCLSVSHHNKLVIGVGKFAKHHKPQQTKKHATPAMSIQKSKCHKLLSPKKFKRLCLAQKLPTNVCSHNTTWKNKKAGKVDSHSLAVGEGQVPVRQEEAAVQPR